MSSQPSPPTKLPTIIDNQSPNTLLAALQRLLPEAQALNVATGYFEFEIIELAI